MEKLDMIHQPRSEAVSYQEVKTKGDYSAKHIHRHDTHEINFLRQGSGCHLRCNGSLHEIDAPALLIQKRGTYHAILSATGPFESRVIYFDPNAAGSLLEKRGLKDALFTADATLIPLTEEAAEEFAPLFDLASREAGDTLLFLLLAVLAKSAALEGKKLLGIPQGGKNEYVFPLIQYIQEHPGEKITIDSLSRRFHVSPTKLKSDFHAVTGETVKAHLTAARLRLADSLLAEKAPLSQIALACGFSGESHLIRAYRAAFGTTPGAKRRHT